MNVIVQLGTTVVASAASPSPSVAFARMQQPHAMQKVAVVTVPKPCTVMEPLVQAIKTEEVEVEEKVDVKVKVEDLQQEDVKPTYHSPLDHATTKEQRLEILKLILQDHNYVAPPVAEITASTHGPSIAASSYSGVGSMYPYGGNNEDDDANSVISSGTGREVEPEGEETETAPEGEGDDDDSVTRCICDFQHDDGYMICCDKCFVWQHVDCMQIDRANIPELYSCERCQPRKVDKQRARTLQLRKREELFHVDSSTDSSSSSSPDCATLRSSSIASGKKRVSAVPPPAVTSTRRKSEPAPSSSSAKSSGKKPAASKQPPAPLPPPPPLRQRRESTTKEQRKAPPVTRRKESKRMPVRRKSKSRTVVSDSDEDSDVEKPSSVQELRQWIEHYEEAVTNHYSPELRARISSIKVNGIHSDLRVGSLPVTPKCRTTILGSGLRILYAAIYLPQNQPIIELRGKYMLSIQHHASVSMQNSRRVRLPPGPYIFFYRLPKDGTEVCVDTSTYGNDARFVRRSCKPNAEMRHCIEKGTLHLYLVTLCKVERGAEITIAHDSSQENLTPVSCACGNPDECSAFSRKNGLHEQISDRERRRRVRRSSTNDGDGQTNQPPTPAPASPNKPSAPVTRRSSAVRSPVKQAPPPRTVTPPAEEASSPVVSNERSHQAKTDAAPASSAATTTVAAATTTTTTTTTTAATTPTSTAAVAVVTASERKAVVTASERKAVVTASERKAVVTASEKKAVVTASERKGVVTVSERKGAASSSVAASSSSSSTSTNTGTASTAAVASTTTATSTTTTSVNTTTATTTTTTTAATVSPSASTPVEESNRKLSREDRKMAAILKAIERMEQQSQKREGGQTKQTQRKEAEPVKKPEPKPEVKPDPPKKEIKKTIVERPRRKRRRGRTRTNSTSTRRSRRDSVDSEASSGDEGPQGPVNSSPGDSQETLESPGHGLSTAAGLLLALANATTPQQNPPSSYRPHTPPSLDKLNSETLGGVNPTMFSSVCDSGGGSSSQGSTPPTPLSSACLLVAAAVDNLAPGFKFPKTKKALMNEWLNQPPTSPEVMVDSALALSHNKCLVQGQGASHAKAGSGSAKKRWLRQAISEEGEAGGSPNSRAGADSPPGLDCVPPLKKRRLARESMSSEQSVTPPLTPTQAADSFPLKESGTATTAVSLPPMCEEEEDDDIEEVMDVADEPEVEILREIPRVHPPVDEDNSNGTEDDVCRGFEQTETVLPRPEPPALSQPLVPSLPPNPQEDEEEDESESESALSAAAQPAKRKVRTLSISEYWQRKQRGSCSEPCKPDDDSPVSTTGAKIHRSSSSSSLSSDDETENSTLALTNLPIFSAMDTAEEKKGGEDINYMKWNSAPTMVEQQRENLTERLRREFGLFLSDDEEQERARKQQSQNAEATVKETKESKKRAPPPPPPHPPPPDTVQPQSYQGGGQKFCHGYASPHVGYGYPAYAMMATSQAGYASHQPPPPGRFSSGKKPYLLPTPPVNPVYNSHSVYVSGSNGSGRPGAASSSAFLTAAAAKAYFPTNHP